MFLPGLDQVIPIRKGMVPALVYSGSRNQTLLAMEVISELLRLLGMLSTRTVLALYNSKVLLNLLLNGEGEKWRCKTLPFYTIRKTRPPSSLGSLFIVTGLVGSRCLRIMIS
jgi:hypothetical protein